MLSLESNLSHSSSFFIRPLIFTVSKYLCDHQMTTQTKQTIESEAKESMADNFFARSIPSFIARTFENLFNSQSKDFATELTKFSATFVPEMLALMRANKVEGAEKVLLAEISAKIIQLDDQQDSSKLDQQSKLALQVTLWLEQLYLIEETTCQRLKANDTTQSLLPDAKAEDIWEKRQLKAVRKMRVQLRKTLQKLQIMFDIRDGAAEGDEQPNQYSQNSASQTDYGSFNEFMSVVVIRPYGSRLYESLHELAAELEVADCLTSELQAIGGGTQRKQSRKPKTPSKLLKAAPQLPTIFAKKTKATQTDSMAPAQTKSRSFVSQQFTSAAAQQPTNNFSSRIQQVLGGRSQAYSRPQLSASDSNQIQKATAVSKRARINGAPHNSSDQILASSDSASLQMQAGEEGLLSSSYPSLDSHSTSGAAAAAVLMARQQSQRSVGFGDQPNFSMTLQRIPSSPMPLQRVYAADNLFNSASTAGKMQMKKSGYTRKLGGTFTRESKVTTRKPKQANFVGIGTPSSSSAVNLLTKRRSSQQQPLLQLQQQTSSVMSFMKGRHLDGGSSQSSQKPLTTPHINVQMKRRQARPVVVNKENRNDLEILGL